MGTRNHNLGTRDMKIAGRIALQTAMPSFSSVKSISDRWNRFIDYFKANYEARRIEGITLDAVLAYGSSIGDLVDEDHLAASTAQNYVSATNRVLEIARGDRALHVSPTRDCGIPKRKGIAITNMAVAEDEHLAWLAAVDPRVAALLRVQRWFGLRFEESAKLDARSGERDKSSGWLRIYDGTKGGRKRKVPILLDEQVLALDLAAEIQGSDRSLIPTTMSYAQFRRECYRTSVRHGIRFHRERHAYAQRRYTDIVGADCPVASQVAHGRAHLVWLAERLGLSLEAAKERDAAARDLVALELGHNRREVTNAYLG